MGSSASATIFYGVLFEPDYEFPWDTKYNEETDEEEGFDGDIEEWWRNVNGYVPPSQIPWEEYRNYSRDDFYEKFKVKEYFQHIRDWEKANPLPVDVVPFGSYDGWTNIALAVNRKKVSADWSYPESFDPKDLKLIVQDLYKLLGFCEKYGLEYKEGPGWFLSAVYG